MHASLGNDFPEKSQYYESANYENLVDSGTAAVTEPSAVWASQINAIKVNAQCVCASQ